VLVAPPGSNVVVGQAGLLDLGATFGFFAVGTYVAALLTSKDSMLHKAAVPGDACRWPMVVTMIAGLILGTPTLRLRGELPGDRDARLR